MGHEREFEYLFCSPSMRIFYGADAFNKLQQENSIKFPWTKIYNAFLQPGTPNIKVIPNRLRCPTCRIKLIITKSPLLLFIVQSDNAFLARKEPGHCSCPILAHHDNRAVMYVLVSNKKFCFQALMLLL